MRARPHPLTQVVLAGLLVAGALVLLLLLARAEPPLGTRPPDTTAVPARELGGALPQPR
jgi:hypothetical protein